jgi:hypothetical protein
MSNSVVYNLYAKLTPIKEDLRPVYCQNQTHLKFIKVGNVNVKHNSLLMYAFVKNA